MRISASIAERSFLLFLIEKQHVTVL